MALSPKINIAQLATSDSVLIQDTTGLYNVTTNVNGYGTPNTAINDVSIAILEIKFPQYDNPYNYTFDVSSGTITTAVRTDPFGNAVNILSDLPNTSFPLNMVLPDTVIFGNTTDKFQDAKLLTKYFVTDGVTSVQYVTNQVFWFYLTILLCVNESLDKYLDGKLLASDYQTINDLFNGFLLSIELYQESNADEYFELLTNQCKTCCSCH